MMEKTLVILKPCTLQRGLVGEITNRFERTGLRLAGMKMVQLTDEVLSEHYAHLSAKPFFQRVKDSIDVYKRQGENTANYYRFSTMEPLLFSFSFSDFSYSRGWGDPLPQTVIGFKRRIPCKHSE